MAEVRTCDVSALPRCNTAAILHKRYHTHIICSLFLLFMLSIHSVFGQLQSAPVAGSTVLMCSSAAEWGYISLSCNTGVSGPYGFISGIESAYYGSITRDCNFTKKRTQCNLALITSYFSRCVGKPSCKLMVLNRELNDIDPCPGYGKSMEVKYYCTYSKSSVAAYRSPDLAAAIAGASDEDGVVYVSIVNCHYLDFVENWILHAEAVELRNFLLIAEDPGSLEYLQWRVPGHVVSSALVGHDGTNDLGLDLRYGDLRFKRLSCRRPRYVQAFVREGATVVFIDIDIAFLRPPSQFIPVFGYDFVGVQDGAGTTALLYSNGVCACLMLWNTRPRSVEMAAQWADACEADETTDDQTALNRVLLARQERQEKSRVFLLPTELFPAGIDYKENKHHCSFWRNPVWVHGNWETGKVNKSTFMANHGGWLVTANSSHTRADCTKS